jgi:N6-adenosine-specific RNA methylase IME4
MGLTDSVIPSHPLADLFPMLGLADADALRVDIATNGLRDRIVILDGKILDGRNRYRAAVGAGVIFGDLPDDASDLWLSHFRRFNPAQDGDPLAWVLSKNLHRRHLSESQRAMVAADIARLGQGRRGPNSENKPANLPVMPTQPEAAELLHVSERSVRSAAKVRDEGAPELVEAVKRGDITVSAAEAATQTLSVGDQIRALQERDPRAFSSFVREKRREQQDQKRDRRQEREADLGMRQAALPDKRFGVILADPEWKFVAYSADTGMDRAADNHYPTSSLEVIKSRPVGDIAADDSALLLWATVPMLPQAFEVMAAWGFAYKSHVVWMKDQVGTGYWFRNQHELLLLGTRGNIPAPAMGEQFRSALAYPLGEHSAKPPFAHEIAEAYWPSLGKIELNARELRAGWDAWGLEAPEAVHAASEGIAVSKAEALEIIKARYTGANGQELADELGRPLNTIRKWAWEAGVSNQARSAARGSAHFTKFNADRERAS